MSNEQFKNNATTTLGSAAASGATTMTVASGTGNNFPTISGSQYFTATLWSAGSTTGVPNEIVRVTSRSGDTMTVVRAQEGTTAQNWNVGDTFANYLTTGFLNGLADSSVFQQQTGNSAVDSGTANAGVVALSPVPANLASLLYSPIRVLKISSANSAAYTLNVNGLGAKAVTIGGVTLAAGQLAGSQLFEVLWDGTNFELISTPALIETAGLAGNSVTNTILNQMVANTVKANLTGGTANPADVGLPALLSSLGFGSSVLSANGYVVLPVLISGVQQQIIIQWGSATIYDDSTSTISFPTTFPNACWYVFPALQYGLNPGGGQGNTIGCWGIPISNSQAVLVYQNAYQSQVPNPGTLGYWAIGH